MNRPSQQRLENSIQERVRGRHCGDNFTLECPIRQRFRQNQEATLGKRQGEGIGKEAAFRQCQPAYLAREDRRGRCFPRIGWTMPSVSIVRAEENEAARGGWTLDAPALEPLSFMPTCEAVAHDCRKSRTFLVLSVLSAIFDDLFRRLVSAAPDDITLNQTVRPDRRADLHHYHRPHREIRLRARSVVTVHHDPRDRHPSLSFSKFLPRWARGPNG